MLDHIEEVNKWAADTIVDDVVVAVGDICDRDYNVGVDILRFESLADFRKAFNDEDEVIKKKVEVVKHNQDHPDEPRAFAVKSVSSGVRVEVMISKTFPGYGSLDIRNRLKEKGVNVQKLGKGMMTEVPEIDMPVEALGCGPTVFAYKGSGSSSSNGDQPHAPASQPIDIQIRCISSVELKSVDMINSENLYEGHADDHFNRTVTETMETSGVQDALSKALTGFEDFIATTVAPF